MELKEFIKTTLTEIAEGINETNAYYKQNGLGAVANPAGLVWDAVAGQPYARLADEREIDDDKALPSVGVRKVTHIDFDVAVTVSKGTGSDAKIGVFSGVLEVGAGGKSESETSSVSRIKFSVPIVLPRGKRLT